MEKNADNIWKRILENKPYHTDLKLYTKGDIKRCISDFIDSEEYEKCQFLTDWLETRFNHELNWKRININISRVNERV